MKLEEMCTVFTDGDWIESKDQSDEGIRLIQTGNIGEGTYLDKGTRAKYISEDTFKKLKCTQVYSGDILVSRLPEPVGRACIIPEKEESMITAVDCTICRPDESIVSKEYLCYFMRSNAYYTRLLSGITGTTRKRISRKNLGNIELDIPSKKEQKKVVKQLDYLVKVVDLRKQELVALDNLIKARFVEMFESVQETCEIGYYIKTLIAGKSLAGESECENKVLKTGAVSFDYFDALQIKNLPVDYKPQKEHLVNVGDIIISRMNTAELTGAAAYVWSVPDKVYIPDRLWKAILEEKCNPIFVWQMLIQPSTKEQIQRECSGTSGSMKNISKAGMLGIKVKKVNIDMQNEFAAFVRQVDKSKVAVKKALDETQLLFDSLMQKYFG